MEKQYNVCRELAKDRPELADEFRQGNSYRDLAKKYLPEFYQQNPKIATSRVMHAIHYLMDEFERKKIGKEHIRANEETFCRNVFREKRGSWAPYNRKILAKGRRKGGNIAGKKTGKINYLAGLGIASLTHEDLVKQGRKAAISRGEIPFEGEEKNTPYGVINEKEFIMFCVILEEYTWKEICWQTNQIWHSGRKYQTIRTMFNEDWKPRLLEQLVEEGVAIPESLIRKKYRLKNKNS